MEAAAEIAHSIELFIPRPACDDIRESSTMLALGSQACSSRRTISSPHRAVERQWIRRTSSPCRYSRTRASSCPTTPTRCGRASPVLPAPPAVRRAGNGTTRGVTITCVVAENWRSNWTSPNGSVVRTRSGPVEKRPRTRPSSGYSTMRRQLRSALSTRKRGRLPSSRDENGGDHRQDQQQQSDPHHVTLAGGHRPHDDGKTAESEETATRCQQPPGPSHRWATSGREC